MLRNGLKTIVLLVATLWLAPGDRAEAALSTDGSCLGACGTGCDNCRHSGVYATASGCFERTTCFVSTCCMNHDACTSMEGFFDLSCAWTALQEGCSMCAGAGFDYCDAEGWYEYYDTQVSWNPADCGWWEPGVGGVEVEEFNLYQDPVSYAYHFGGWSVEYWYGSVPDGDACSGKIGCTIVGTCPDCECVGGQDYEGCP